MNVSTDPEPITGRIELSVVGNRGPTRNTEAKFLLIIHRQSAVINSFEKPADDFLLRREQQLRDQFTQLQQIIDQGDAQFNQVLSFQNSFGF